MKNFQESIRKRVKEKKRGNIESIIITQDKVIVSGHQRVRAFKELGIQTIEAEIRIYNSDDEILLDLLESNIRRRGEVGGSAKKIGKRIKELERLYEIEHGGSRRNNCVLKTQEQLAKEMDMDVRTLQNYKILADMIPELEDLVDTGIVTKDTALAIIKNLTNDEQRELISSMDITKKITKKEAKKYIDEIKSLKKENKDLKSSNLSAEKLSTLKIENEKLEKENKILESQKKYPMNSLHNINHNLMNIWK